MEWSDTYEPRFVNKKRASQSKVEAERLVEAGYRFPLHWRNHSNRPFVAWDGEGITYPGNVVQSYVLFGASTGDRISKTSLGTADCFDLLLAVEAANPNAIHVGFSIQYDCNMLFRDLTRRHLDKLYRTNKCRWEGYRIEYRPGKWLSIRKDATVIRLFDVFGFFQASFVKACRSFLGDNDPELQRIIEGKQARSSFSFDQLDTFIVPYWETELRLLVRLMDSLRDDLNEAGLPINSWHGPGAVANTVFRQFNIKQSKGTDIPKEVNRAAQYAYAGGRFEQFKCGHYPGTIYEYDIRSAYPAAIAELPSLSNGNWRTTETFEPNSFGVWHVRYDRKQNPSSLFTMPQPLFYRDRNGNISYPPFVEGWYWTPEASIVSDSVTHGYVFDHDGSKPFEFVRSMYETRKEWKRIGNSAERALKLALNSLYGKMAQRTGWLQEGDPIPTWHQLEWAGFVTSATRAKLYAAFSGNMDTVVAVETDAIFSKEPLPSLELSPNLGDWELTTFDWITYIQSGLYYASTGGKMVERYRGFDQGSLPYKQVIDYLSDDEKRKREPLYGQTTRFIGMGLGLHTKATWRSWDTSYRAIRIGGGGKRTHVSGICKACKAGISMAKGLHDLTVITAGGKSYPHTLPWLTSEEPKLRELEELAKW